MRFVGLLTMSLIVLTFLPVSRGQEVKLINWKISDVTISRSRPTLTSDHIIMLTITNGDQSKPRIFKSETFIERVTLVQQASEAIIILGSGVSFDEALVVEPKTGIVYKRFIAYGIRMIGGRWLVSVEWYPNHLFPPQYSSDVVLIQDLQKITSPLLARKDQSAEKDLEWLVRSAGVPIYPEPNAVQNDYHNVVEDHKILSRVYLKTFAIIQGNSLVFVASLGTEQEQQSQRLVIVKLGTNTFSGVNIRYQSLDAIREKLHLQQNSPIQISAVDEVSAGLLKFQFQKGLYPVDEALLSLYR